MGFSRIYSGAVVGIEARLVEVEVNIDDRAFPVFNIIGLASKEIDESRERVKSAIKSCGYKFPNKKIVVNLAPADLKKSGSYYDVGIAMGILIASGQLDFDLSGLLIVGELSLNGRINHLPAIFMIGQLARKLSKVLCLPDENTLDISLFEGLKFYASANLKQFIDFVSGNEKYTVVRKAGYSKRSVFIDFKEIRGQETAKRALQICAAGKHNLSLIGPSGVGKTLLAESIRGILPDCGMDELIEINKVRSLFNKLAKKQIEGIVYERPFRSPHHTCTSTVMLGGGLYIKPGEISQAHGGVLFLDEFLLFNKNVIDALRTPIEDRNIGLRSYKEQYEFPCDFILIAASNACPCGNLGNQEKECVCRWFQIKNHFRNMDGAITDRIDLHVFCSPVDFSDMDKSLYQSETGIDSETAKQNVLRAVKVQEKRYESFADASMKFNGRLDSSNIDLYIKLSDVCREFLRKSSDKLGLSVRSYHNLLKVSRTIADLEVSEFIELKHISEAMQYRLRAVSK